MSMKRWLYLVFFSCVLALFPVTVLASLPWWIPTASPPQGVYCETAPCSPLVPDEPVFHISGTTIVVRIGTNTFTDRSAPAVPRGTILAAPAIYPGTLIAATPSGTIYRRSSSGHWHLSLQLLPNLPNPVPPHITGCAAMPGRLTGAVYCSTRGDGMFVSTDAGITWYRANDGLPLNLDAVVADPARHAFAARSGTNWFLHVLRALPEPTPPCNLPPLGFWILAVGSIVLTAALLYGILWHWKEQLLPSES